MDKVTVYRVRQYNIANDEFHFSRRMATEAGAKIMRAEIVPNSAMEIDRTDLEPGEEWTRRDYGTPRL